MPSEKYHKKYFPTTHSNWFETCMFHIGYLICVFTMVAISVEIVFDNTDGELHSLKVQEHYWGRLLGALLLCIVFMLFVSCIMQCVCPCLCGHLSLHPSPPLME